ncbi:unnamed protein product [Arctia plantaginis]|uniref:Uncharacterized protein n=1 Tax=Arctia plantaginis TaxID=874455 RepID=A0A8S1AS98_ARCPL|nr:unnamed protein product [Arctia plantaginis]
MDVETGIDGDDHQLKSGVSIFADVYYKIPNAYSRSPLNEGLPQRAPTIPKSDRCRLVIPYLNEDDDATPRTATLVLGSPSVNPPKENVNIFISP